MFDPISNFLRSTRPVTSHTVFPISKLTGSNSEFFPFLQLSVDPQVHTHLIMLISGMSNLFLISIYIYKYVHENKSWMITVSFIFKSQTWAVPCSLFCLAVCCDCLHAGARRVSSVTRWICVSASTSTVARTPSAVP